MPKFILIDHSLQNLSGHHFEYALHVLTAAERAGFEPWLIAHREFQRPPEMPAHWSVKSAYRHTRYFKLCFDTLRFRVPKQRRFEWLRHQFGLWSRARRRRGRAIDFAADTAAALAGIAFERRDQVFIPTLTEIDLRGLARYLAAMPQAELADWHVQFHLPIYTGYEPDYPAEDASLDRLRRIYRRTMPLPAKRNLHLYTTTETLAIQYNRLGVGPFHALPYPHNPALEPSRADSPRRAGAPLRIAFLGGARSEKGYQDLPAIVGKLWTEHVERGKTRFVIHSAFELPGPTAAVAAARAALGRLPPDKVSLLDQPLDSGDYCQLNRQCDIGLLPYDRSRYHARCSGVLVELLSAGVPVVVPAGTWLADQLAEPNRKYHLRLRESQPIAGRMTTGKSTSAAVPRAANYLLLSLRWPLGIQLCTGGYARVQMTCWAAGGRMLGRRAVVVGPGLPDRLSTALVRLEPDTAEVTVVWRNAYGTQPLEFGECELCFLRSDPARPLPLGAVGLAAAEREQIAEMLDDVIRHHAHYRQTALEFAPRWNAWHNPARVVSELVARASSTRPQVDAPRPHGPLSHSPLPPGPPAPHYLGQPSVQANTPRA
jgi:glycosyltransferase involved in cell wall biosynthesis